MINTLSEKHQWYFYKGDYKIVVGSNSAGEKLIAELSLDTK
jgi:hypothetical protein